MPKEKTCLSINLYGSILLALFGCADSQEQQASTSPIPLVQNEEKPDLSEAIAKRVEGNSTGAIRILRKLNEEFPNSPEVLLQLARSLQDQKNFPLAAFRFEQALSVGAPKEVHRETADSFLASGDETNALKHFEAHLQDFPDQKNVWLLTARLLAKAGRETDAINAFSRAPELCSHKDALTIANLFYQKKLWTQSARWFRESAKREVTVSPEPLLGLLRVSFAQKDEDQAESLALAIEKVHPGTLQTTDLNMEVSDLLRRRRLADLLEVGVSTQQKNASDLAAALLSEKPPPSRSVVSSGPKLSTTANENALDLDATTSSPMPQETDSFVNLADAFAVPAESDLEMTPLEKGRNAYLNSSYSEALAFSREALKSNPSDAEAWRLSSQAHFQLGEEREAEMTILEAIRHAPFELDIRLDYLRIARESLSAKRYLAELEKSKELFPESVDILWELARRYHLVEKMPVTAGILYREVMKFAPSGSALHEQAKMEIVKLQSL